MTSAMSLLMAVVALSSSAAVVSGYFAGQRTYVNFMSMQMEAAELNAALPNLPALAGNLGLTELVDLVVKANLAGALSGTGPFTVFGPTNKALNDIPAWLKKAIENKDKLVELLKFHVASGEAPSSAIKQDLLLPTLQGQSIRFNLYKNNSVITAQCAPINLKKVDQKASNGLLHELNSVMVPPMGDIVTSAVACPAFKTLVTAVKAAGLVDALSGKGPLTLFAPTDSAFAKIPKETLDNLLKNKTALTDVLTYHVTSGTICSSGLEPSQTVTMLNKQTVDIVVSGGEVILNKDVKVVAGGADGSVTNGVVHAIDTVLLPPSMR